MGAVVCEAQPSNHVERGWHERVIAKTAGMVDGMAEGMAAGAAVGKAAGAADITVAVAIRQPTSRIVRQFITSCSCSQASRVSLFKTYKPAVLLNATPATPWLQ